MQTAEHHNEVMVKKQATWNAAGYGPLRVGKSNHHADYNSKGKLLKQTFGEYSPPACLEVVEIMCLKEQAYVHTEPY